MLGHGPSIVRDGLVLCLDAANPKSYPGIGTTWYDLSGNGNHGTLQNGVGYNTSNKGSMTFDGIDDYINLNVAFNQSASQNQYTLIIGAKLSTISSSRRQMWSPDNGGFDWGFGSGDGEKFTIFSGEACYTGKTQDLNWHIFTGQWSASGTKLYIDNKIDISTTSISYDSSISSTTNIGRNPGFGEYFNGNISFVCLYNKILTDAEISQNFRATRGRYEI